MADTKRVHRRNDNSPGHAHELTFTCYQGYSFLQSERTCQWLADAITGARETYQFALWAYVFMPNHVHLIVYSQQSNYNISDIRAAIKLPVARRAKAYLRKHSPEWLPRLTRQRGKRTETLFGSLAAGTIAM